MKKICIRIAGHTAAACLQTLLDKGYRVTVEACFQADNEAYAYDWNAEKDNVFFSATCPEELLGLVSMWEVRGNAWTTTENERNVYQALIENAPVFDSNGNQIEFA